MSPGLSDMPVSPSVQDFFAPSSPERTSNETDNETDQENPLPDTVTDQENPLPKRVLIFTTLSLLALMSQCKAGSIDGTFKVRFLQIHHPNF